MQSNMLYKQNRQITLENIKLIRIVHRFRRGGFKSLLNGIGIITSLQVKDNSVRSS